MIPTFLDLLSMPVRVRTEVWRAPGLEIRIDVLSTGERRLHDGDGAKLIAWVSDSNCHPSEYMRVGAFLAGEEKGVVEWPMPEK